MHLHLKNCIHPAVVYRQSYVCTPSREQISTECGILALRGRTQVRSLIFEISYSIYFACPSGLQSIFIEHSIPNLLKVVATVHTLEGEFPQNAEFLIFKGVYKYNLLYSKSCIQYILCLPFRIAKYILCTFSYGPKS